MARQDQAAAIALGAYATAGVVLTFLAADTVNDEETLLTGQELVIAQNTTGGALTVTISAVNDPFNRSVDLAADSIPANSFKIYGPFKTLGWQQTDGNLYFSGSAVGIEFAVVRLPG